MISFKDKITLLTPHLLIDKLALFLSTNTKNNYGWKENEGYVFIFLACDYSNLGDFAITLAQKKILKGLYPCANVIEIPIGETYQGIKAVKSRNNHDDVVTIIGGGNMGTLHYGYERKRNLIVECFKRNKVISFPQSIFYSDDFWGRRAQERSYRSYSSHPNIKLMARDEDSAYIMRNMFPGVPVDLMPDAVLTLEAFNSNGEREGIICCLRDDEERAVNDDLEKQIQSVANELSLTIDDYREHQIKTFIGESVKGFVGTHQMCQGKYGFVMDLRK